MEYVAMGLLRRTFLPAAMLVALFAAVIAGVALAANAAEPGVTETPRLDTMQVINGEVFDSVIVGNRVIVVGDFTQVRNPGGNTINQPYVAAYNVNTGQFDGSYHPSVDNFVNAIANDGSDVFIVGQFGTVDGESHRRIAKLNSNGDVVSAFDASMGTTPEHAGDRTRQGLRGWRVHHRQRRATRSPGSARHNDRRFGLSHKLRF